MVGLKIPFFGVYFIFKDKIFSWVILYPYPKKNRVFILILKRGLYETN